MPTSRSYRDACPIARTLDAIGERWAVLVVRELLLGPLRFSDLRRALPAASTNMLTDRLRELEAHGVVRRATLPPPAASAVYELTARGRELEPVLIALGTWGSGQPAPADASLTATSVLLFLRGSATGHPGMPKYTYRVQLGDRVWTIAARDGELQLTAGEPGGGASGPTGETGETGESATADAGITTDPLTFNALLADPSALDRALRDDLAKIDGDRDALHQLLALAGPAARAQPPSE